jgi:nitroimidazol reductase NimA-like FMN-containing flavoprotein (pyridoxamine 5'-phosphate oxidase superfamily)
MNIPGINANEMYCSCTSQSGVKSGSDDSGWWKVCIGCGKAIRDSYEYFNLCSDEDVVKCGGSMRRKDRQVSSFSDIVEIIEKCDVIRLGMSDNGIPYIVPLDFGYEARDGMLTFYFHSAREGRKIDILKSNPYVCFEMDCSHSITRHEQACEWSAEHESVIGYGSVSFLEKDFERKSAMDAIMKKYGFEGTPEYSPHVFGRTALYKLTVESMNGKRNMGKRG